MLDLRKKQDWRPGPTRSEKGVYSRPHTISPPVAPTSESGIDGGFDAASKGLIEKGFWKGWDLKRNLIERPYESGQGLERRKRRNLVGLKTAGKDLERARLEA